MSKDPEEVGHLVPPALDFLEMRPDVFGGFRSRYIVDKRHERCPLVHWALYCPSHVVGSTRLGGPPRAVPPRPPEFGPVFAQAIPIDHPSRRRAGHSRRQRGGCTLPKTPLRATPEEWSGGAEVELRGMRRVDLGRIRQCIILTVRSS